MLKTVLPDIKHVKNFQFGYVMERNKKFTIGTNGELGKAMEYFEIGYQMWLYPTPMTKPLKAVPSNSKASSG